MNAPLYLHSWENSDFQNLAIIFSLFFFFYGNAKLQCVFLSGRKNDVSFWGQLNEETPLQSTRMLVVGMELWRSL